MLRNEDEILAEAYGLLARGYKKLRAIHRKRSLLSSQRRSGTTCPETDSSSDSEIGPKSSETFLTKKGVGAWGQNFLGIALEYSMRGEVRADRFKNYWAKDLGILNGWRPISVPQFMEFYQQAETFVSECQELVRGCKTKEEFEEQTDAKLRDSKWARRRYIVEPVCRLDFKTFLNFCRQEHKRLPPLRGGAVRRGNKNCLK